MLDELHSVELFASLAEAQALVADWREDYNERRPHSALAMQSPARFAHAWRENDETGKATTPGGSPQGRRTPQNAPLAAAIAVSEPDPGPKAPTAASAASLRSPSGLPPRDGDAPTYDATPTHHRLSQKVDR